MGWLISLLIEQIRISGNMGSIDGREEIDRIGNPGLIEVNVLGGDPGPGT